MSLEYLGGAVVYVNGVELGRKDMPDGAIDPYSLATDYPIEAYTTEDGQTPLPMTGGDRGALMDPKWASRYQARIRKVSLDVPSKVLVKGANLLAIELHRPAVSGPVNFRAGMWGQVGIRTVTVSSGSGAGVIGYADALKGTRVWSAQELEQIAERPVPGARLPVAWSVGGRAAAVAGIAAGNPFDPLVPMRVLVPRNGIGNAVAGVAAKVKDFTGPGGAALSATTTRVRFAVQDANFHWCDTLLEKAPEGMTTLPVWLEVKAPKDQTPGWYVSTLSLEANGKQFQVPVQVFVTGYVLVDSKDFRTTIGVMHSPEVAAKIANAQPWTEAHMAMMAKSLEAAGQLGNDIMYVPVMVGDHMGHQTGLIRWIKTEKGLQPDFTAFEKYLDLYLKYCAPPKAIILYVWGNGVTEVARGYEGAATPSSEVQKKQPLQVTQWDPATGNNTPVAVPSFLEEGAEAIWKPMLDGVHKIVLKRGWSERVIMVGTGSDVRPGIKTGEIFRKWAPYARWDIYSHFSGDPAPGSAKGFFYKGPVIAGSAPGKQMAIGNLEVGVKEYPWSGYTGVSQMEFLDMPLERSWTSDLSSPLVFLSLPLISGRFARLGLDFWPGDVKYSGLIWGAYPLQLMARGATGALPTVRLQMVREGVQNFEARLTIIEAMEKLSEEQKKPYQGLLNDILRGKGRLGGGSLVLSQTELNLDAPGSHLAQIYRAAEELTGIKTEAKWEEPPK
ncbi:MAG: glycoside hydrolase domain-containing protein [Thermoguttaceae bacterium]